MTGRQCSWWATILAALAVLILSANAATAGEAMTDRSADEQAESQSDDSSNEADKAENGEAEEGEEDAGPLGYPLEKLTLERLFPEDSYWGTSASQTSFSADGRYGAFLYRPRIERRHGNDLWIHDFETGETKRITKVSVLREFQEATRKVSEDRIKTAKKLGLDKKLREEREKAKENGASDERNGGGEQDGDGDGDGGEAELLPDDGVSGEWSGTLTGGEELGLETDEVPFTLSIEVSEDGEVAGTMRAMDVTVTITQGTYDVDSGDLALTLTDPETGMTADLAATVEDGAMSGTLTLGDAGELALEANRTKALARTVERETDGEQSGEEQSDDQEERDQGEGEEEEEIELGDVVSEKDADNRRAPRYGGVQTYTWAPESNELIFTSAGDLYRYDVESEEITRLTRTQEPERGVQYLPDGSGYTHMQGAALMKVRFEDGGLLEQINPALPGGVQMTGYEVSPDGRKIAFTSNKGGSPWGRSRTVSIISYRDRFAQVRQVPRHMSDDPIPNIELGVWVYELDGHLKEEGRLTQVFTTKLTGPRDHLSEPAWSPDASRFAFANYQQDSGVVRIMEVRLPDEPKDETSDGEGDEAAKETQPAKERPKIEPAQDVYRLLHNGGPSTPGMINPEYLPDNRRLVFITEISGFRHLHTLDPVYEQLEQLTTGRYEVVPFAMSRDHKYMFALSTKAHPSQHNVYRVDLMDGELTRLNDQPGAYSSVAVSDDGTKLLANHEAFGRLRELAAIDVEDETREELTDSHTEEAKILTRPEPEYFEFKNRNGQTIYGHMFKPLDYSDEDKRPLLMYVYGGPLGTRNMITTGAYSSASYFFAYYMAYKHGYVTATVDPRGVSGFGGLFEKSNYEQAGKPQVEDLVDAAHWIAENFGVDKERMGLHGWSFGGFQTQMTLYTEPDVFAAGIAGAGPTEWHNYNSWYSTGTIGPSRTGQTDLAKYSLLPLAKNLKARLLLVHGMEDSNVLYQDTVRVYRELLQAGKEVLVDLFLDPTGGHGLGGDIKNLGMYRKYEAFLLDALGTGEPAEPVDDAEEADDASDDDEDDITLPTGQRVKKKKDAA